MKIEFYRHIFEKYHNISMPQCSPRTPAECIAATTPGLIVRILKFWF